ncbi:MAG: RnfABCDGE type electron transport complex subunit G [Pseudomonadota bacterium]
MSNRDQRWHGALTLTLLAAGCAALVAGVYSVAEPRLADNLEKERMARYAAVLRGTRYDTIAKQALRIDDDAGTDSARAAVRVYGVFDRGELTAMLIETTSVGYAGAIDLVVGVDRELSVLGVRVLRHRETPGIGDFIDAQRTDWIRQFEQQSIDTGAYQTWRLTSDGGRFDAVSGATVTARAVVRGVRDALTLLAQSAARPTLSTAERADDD